jgi:hypothetical protein
MSQVPLQSEPISEVLLKPANQPSPTPMDVYQVPISGAMAESQPSPTTAPMVVPKTAPHRVFRALIGRCRPSIAAVIDSKLDRSTTDRGVATLPSLKILEERPERPPPHA